MKTASTKSVAQTAQSNARTLAALKQLLTPDEVNLFAACAAIEGKSVTKFARHELRRTMYSCYECAEENADNAANPDLIRAHAALVPLVDKLNWLGLNSFPEKN